MWRGLHTLVPQKLRRERCFLAEGCISSGQLYGDIRILRTSGSEPAVTEQVVAEVAPSPFELSKMSRSI